MAHSSSKPTSLGPAPETAPALGSVEVCAAVRLPEIFEANRVLYLPAGVQRIRPVKGPEAWVSVDQQSAATIEAHRAAVEAASGKRVYFDFHHRNLEASFWPSRFVWSETPKPGVYAEGEYSAAGRAGVEGKMWREFSPKCWITLPAGTERNPSRIIGNPDAAPNLGGFVNDGAFAGTELWNARNLAGAAGETQNNEIENQDMKKTAEELAALKASQTKLQTEIVALQARVSADAKDELAAARLEAANQQHRANAAEIQAAEAADRADKAETTIKAANKVREDAAIEAAKKRGALPTQGQKATEIEAHWRRVIGNDVSNIALLEQLPGNPVLAGRVTDGVPASRIELGFDRRGAFRRYLELVCASTTRLGPARAGSDPTRQLDRGESAVNARRMASIEAANFYKRELEPNFTQFGDMPMSEIEAADNTDTNLGTLSGVIVLQRTLPLFKYQFPVLSALYQDFSATPGLYNVSEITRIISVPAVQQFDATLDSTGRPKGWGTVTAMVATDASVKLDSYIGVPVVFGNTLLAGTIRRLFDEFGPASMYAMAKQFVSKVTTLMTPANFNAYAAQTAADASGNVKVPDAYPTYAVALKNFSVDSFQDIEAAFDANEVPPIDRGLISNAKYYNQAKRDPRLSLFFAAAKDEAIITEGKLPGKVEGFVPFRGPWLPNTNGMVGFAFQKAGIILKQRLPTDWTTALNVMIPGSVTTVTDPETGLSCLLVQYVNLQGGFAEWRLETMIGAAVGDKRAGLVITSA